MIYSRTVLGGGRVSVPVLVDPRTVRCGDTILVGGLALTVENMTLLGLGVRRLEFGGGETFTMRPATALWASRKVDPRRRPPQR